MARSFRASRTAALLTSCAIAALCSLRPALADETSSPVQAAATAADDTVSAVVVTIAKTTRSAVQLDAVETQKLLPGMNPLKAIQTLPGVLFETADPWGNNEQNEELFVHGFSTQQLGYTLDGVPLGDQQYGNYNGLSISRAVTSENVGRVSLSSGAGALGVASTSNLGGAIETVSSDPTKTRGLDVRETLGSYGTNRTFVRLDTGALGQDGQAYISYLHQDARAWDFDGHQKGDQVNVKYVHNDTKGKLTLYGDWQAKVEPNEDAIQQGTGVGASYYPYTRPFLYPDYGRGLAYLTSGLAGSPPAQYGTNFSNYFSAAQRADILSYAKYEANLTPDITWSNQAYYHYDYGRGIVAGPINQAGLPGLFGSYFPNLVVGSTTSATSLANLAQLFGGTGYEVRTTEYRINRDGLISTLLWNLGPHAIEAGLWYEHNESATHRVWYPFSAANNDLTPYDIPSGKSVLTQYYIQMTTDDVQLHLQDQWRVTPTLLLQAGIKSSLQTASSQVPIEQVNLPTANPPTVYPVGSITSNEWFLPQFGGVWDINEQDQAFFNIQKNLRQFIPYGAGSNFFGASPWSLGSQAAFEQFKATAHPESAWTYEGGVRGKLNVNIGPLTSVEGQVSAYHVDFSNRLLNIAAYNFINPGASILVNVGGVTTNGADLATTFNFGSHFHLYNALSYNSSKYNSNYSTAAKVSGVLTNVTVPISGKQVPATPDWLDKTILSANFGPFDGQVTGDFIGRRYTTYLNDLKVASPYIIGLEAGYRLPISDNQFVRSARLSLNVTNIADRKGVSTISITAASGTYQEYPVEPRMVFVTLQAKF